MIQNLSFWQVDAFTDTPFKGNPAAVVIVDAELSDVRMQSIATEMNLSETAFVLLREGRNPLLRWFTPFFEMDLCGHATLATAHVMLTELHRGAQDVRFDTKSVGELYVSQEGDSYTMRFPTRVGERQDLHSIPPGVLQALSSEKPISAYKSRDLMLVYDDERVVWSMTPDFSALKAYPDPIIVTAKTLNTAYDFVSRYFCAHDAIVEDPVTGSAHCTLGPYWSERLAKNKLQAFQASARGGELWIEIDQQSVLISGKAVTVLDGKIRV